MAARRPSSVARVAGPRRHRRRAVALAGLILALPLVAIPAATAAADEAPWDGTPISAGLGPTYGESWCADAAPGSSIANQQSSNGTPTPLDTLALIPHEAIPCTLDQIIAEGQAAGLPSRLTYGVNTTTDAGRNQYKVIVNALETPEQRRDFARWKEIRAQLPKNPEKAQRLLTSYGADVKLPIFIEANIHGNEEEGADAMMQVFRDLATTPRGVNAAVDAVLDHAILIVIPSQNPDGRFLGTRANANGFDNNRDLLVQSQPEIRANVKLQLEWLAPVMLAMHGYVNPTLIDGLTKPHNPGLEYDLFAKWNQRRLDANVEDFANYGESLTIPVRDYGANAGQQANIAATNGATQSGTTVTITTTGGGGHGLSVGQEVRVAGVGEFAYDGTWTVTSVPTTSTFTYEHTVTGLAPSGQGVIFTGSPAVAEGWDDWGPFYTQTYAAYFGVDGSTLEMCSNLSCGGRLGSKTAQYVGFYSSADFWVANRQAILADQIEVARRNVRNAPRVACCDAQELIDRGFDPANHEWAVPYPKAFLIPDGTSSAGKPPAADDGQRSATAANRLIQWLLDNSVQVERLTRDVTVDGQLVRKGSHVVYMNQLMRGFAYTALSAGQDISDRITTLYAPPGAWSHGQLWGADTIEVPADAAVTLKSTAIKKVEKLEGGLRGGGRADWYALAIRGVTDARVVLDVLRDGIDGELAEASFASESGGTMPAGSVLFQRTRSNERALKAATKNTGVWFERVLASKLPPTTQLDEAPTIGVLVNNATLPRSDTVWGLEQIFGDDVRIVSLLAGTDSVQNGATDPLADIDVLYNTGVAYPATINVAAAPTGATQAGTTATIQTTAAHNLAVGSIVTVAGVGVAEYNGTHTVTAVSSPSGSTTVSRFSYELGVSGLAASGGGTVTYDTARARVSAFFAAGGGYLGTSVSAGNFGFLTAGGLVAGSFTQGSATAGGGIARWTNEGGVASPITGAYPATDFWYLPSNVTYFSAVPTGAVVDGRYPAGPSAGPVGPTELFVSGLWRARDSANAVAAVGAPVVVHGPTLVDSRYLGFATNPFSRGDFERAWPLIATTALWTNLTDEP